MNIPEFKEQGLSQYLTEREREFDRLKRETLSGISANTSLLLYSPSKMVFELKVDDAGVIHVTKVSG